MKRKFATMLAAAGLIAAMAGSAAHADTGTIKVWVADKVLAFTQDQIGIFMNENPDFSAFDIAVEAVNENDAAGRMFEDVTSGADIFVFPQDQVARLVAAGALDEVALDNYDFVQTENDAGSVDAATVSDILYAYPVTSDNGYFLYYDRSVVSDPSTLEGILADCEAAGKNFYMELDNGWYQAAFFFATGARMSYETDESGHFTSCDAAFSSDEGLTALKEILTVSESPVFKNGSSASEAENMAAIIDGTWDSSVVKALLGDNYACARLPVFTGSDGQTYQMGGFGGYKLIGVKPQEDEGKLAACNALAAYLSGTQVQLARYEQFGWGPSNLDAQQSPSVQADLALAALRDQLQFTIPQGQYPGEYWDLCTKFGNRILDGELSTASSDEELAAALEEFQTTCISFAG